jgi:outer membrane protein assembly factor BamB
MAHSNWRLFGLILPLFGVACGGVDSTDAAEADSAVTADTYAVTSDHRLVHFERQSGAVARIIDITGLAAGDAIIGADYRPADSTFYVVTRNGKLYVMNPDRGALLVRASLGADEADTSDPFSALEGEVFGVNFNPVADRLRVVSNTGQNLRVDADTGATISDSPLDPGASIGAATYSNPFSSACRTQLFMFDTSSNALALQDPPNDGTLQPLGVVPMSRGAGSGALIEIVTGDDGRGRALMFWPSDDGATIYDLDVRSGDLSSARALRLRPGESLVGVSARPPAQSPRQALGELLGVSTSNTLVSFNRSAPGQLCTRDPIVGLQPEETVLGIDTRPADGALYALGSAGNVYTLDANTAEATRRATLAADPSDTSQPYVGLPAGEYGIGFNPVPDRLRVVNRDGLNLRINVDTGATNTDAALSPTSMAVPSVAYTNSFAGATSTALFAIDPSRGVLALIGSNPATAGACPDDTGNPNCGNVSEVGPLGLDDMTDVGGFDIEANPAANLGWLALTQGDRASSALYAIDLVTGAVALPPGVANPTIGGAEPLHGLTLTSPATASSR